MADHAGGRCSVVNPGIKLWHPPVKVTQFWRPRIGMAPDFCKIKKDYIGQEEGKKYETKVVGNDSSYCLASYKRAPQLSARVNHGTPAAGVIGHIQLSCL